MNVIGHQAIRPHRNAGALAPLCEQRPIGEIIIIAEEDRLPPIAALRDVMRQTWRNNACEPGHGRKTMAAAAVRQLSILSP